MFGGAVGDTGSFEIGESGSLEPSDSLVYFINEASVARAEFIKLEK